MRLPPITKTNKILLSIMAATFFLDAFGALLFKVSLNSLLAFSLSNPLGIITFSFLSHGLIELIFNGLLFWMLGSELERSFGTKSYLLFLLLIALGTATLFGAISALFPALMSAPLYGVTIVASGMILIYGLLNPEQSFTFMLMIPVQAKYFIWILIAIELYSGIFTPGGAGAISSLIAMGISFAYYYLKFKRPPPRKGGRGKFKVVEGGQNNPRYYQ